LAVGASLNNNSTGHVRLFEWKNDNWEQIGDDIDGEAMNDFSGADISLSSQGNRVAIGAIFNGASGHVRVYGDIITEVITPSLSEKIKIYPNPVLDYLNISTDKKTDIRLLDVLGRTILEHSTHNSSKLDLSDIEQGIYWLEIQYSNELFTEKIYKN